MCIRDSLCTTEEASYSLKVFLIVIMAVFNASFFVSWFWKVAKDFIKKKIRSHDKLRPHLEKVENILKRRLRKLEPSATAEEERYLSLIHI
eukprot:TRINITY_DN11302_c0_g2_i1.p1 TRINITY_DN11302_c0_g2~~TRINITY_DN11302_c0_g2_i1.p1  ORF type:complete len:107 (+),score=26.75 TRINITY_DN11302_c0_g2_i1:49-321(+)